MCTASAEPILGSLKPPVYRT